MKKIGSTNIVFLLPFRRSYFEYIVGDQVIFESNVANTISEDCNLFGLARPFDLRLSGAYSKSVQSQLLMDGRLSDLMIFS